VLLDLPDINTSTQGFANHGILDLLQTISETMVSHSTLNTNLVLFLYKHRPFWRSPSHGAQPLGLSSSHQSSHQCAQARPAHPPPPKLARHLRLTNQAALRCQGMGRGGGGAGGRTVKTRIIHTSVRRPAQRTPRPQNLHSDPNLQIRQPCGVRGRGGAGGGAAGRTLERKFEKFRLRAWPEPRSQRPGQKLDR